MSSRTGKTLPAEAAQSSKQRLGASGRVASAGLTPLAIALRAVLWSSAVAAPVNAWSETPAVSDSEGRGQLEEVVVTAQRRTENVQDVPVSLQVLGEEQLKQLHVQQFEDYIRFLPSVSSNGANAGFNATVVIRGVVTDQGNIASGSLPAVGQYLDEQPITTIDGAPDLHMYDIARVEQLSGPQGTLFGASSMGGVLRIITNKPDKSGFAGGIDLSSKKFAKGGFGGSVEGFVNLPINDRAALRLVGWLDRVGGYIDNVAATRTYNSTGITVSNAQLAKRDYNDADTLGGRAALAIDLSEHWTVTPSIMAQKRKRNGTSAYNPLVGDLQNEVYVPEDGVDRFYQAALTVQGKIGDFDMIYAGGLFRRKAKQHINYADYDYWYDQLYGTYPTRVDDAGNNIEPNQTLINENRFTKQSHEVRIASAAADRFRIVAGAFYQRQFQAIDLDYNVPGLASGLSVSTREGAVWLTRQERIDRDYALFGQADFDITKKLTLTAGSRYYRYDNSLFGWFGTRANEAACFGPAVVPGSPCTNLGTLDANGTPIPRRVKGDGYTYRLGATYKFDRDHMIYVSVADGFRPGGTNRLGERGQQNLGSATIPYGPDSLTNYEIGTRNSFWDRRAKLNLTVFDQEWKDIQLTATIGGVGLIQNVGKARTRGVELTASIEPVSGLNLTVNAAYIDSKLLSDYFFGSTLRAAAGSRLPYSAKFKGNAILRYSWKTGDYEPYAQVAQSYQSSTVGGFTNFERNFFGNYPAYGITDLSLGVGKNPWWVGAYANNVFDKRAVTYRTYVYFVPQSGFYQYAEWPRRFGVYVSYRF